MFRSLCVGRKSFCSLRMNDIALPSFDAVSEKRSEYTTNGRVTQPEQTAAKGRVDVASPPLPVNFHRLPDTPFRESNGF